MNASDIAEAIQHLKTAIEPKPGETWHFKLPGAIALSTAVIEQVTPATIQFRSCVYGCTPVRYCRQDITLIERVSTPIQSPA